MKLRLLHVTLLALGLLVGCGGSASRNPHDAQPQGGTGGAGDDRPGAAGETAMAGSAAAPASGGPSAGGSGASLGGAPNGGRSQDLGGTAGVGGAPALALPPGCELRSHMETADTCSLGAYCATSPSVITNCRLLNSGRWECQCDPAKPDRVYQVDNAPGLQACAVAARLCSESGLKVGKETCAPTNDVSGQDTCAIDITCSKPIDLGANTEARAWLTRVSSASCNRTNLGFFECTCSDAPPRTFYDLLADSGELACGPLVDFCMSGATPTFEGAPECWVTDTNSGTLGCDRIESCAVKMPLAEGASLAQIEGNPAASCQPLPDGGSDCYCRAPDGNYFSFQLALAPDYATCDASALNCAPGAVITATGTASCEPDSVEALSADSCQAFLSCVQDATVDNRVIVAEGKLGLTCARAANGMPWWCSCSSGQDTARFELGAADVTAYQACSQAPAACQEHLTVHLGSYGDYVEPPDPLQ